MKLEWCSYSHKRGRRLVCNAQSGSTLTLLLLCRDNYKPSTSAPHQMLISVNGSTFNLLARADYLEAQASKQAYKLLIAITVFIEVLILRFLNAIQTS